MFLSYSIPILRSMAVSVLPTSTEIPLVLLSEPVRLPSTPLAVREAPPPMWTPSTSCAAMPAIEETTVSLIIVAPRSLRSGLSLLYCPDSLISHAPPSTKFSRVFPEQPRRNQNTSIRLAKTSGGWQGCRLQHSSGDPILASVCGSLGTLNRPTFPVESRSETVT